jgi:hypothetical protein
VVAEPAVAPAQAGPPTLAKQQPRTDDPTAKARDDEGRKAAAAERRKQERRRVAERRKRELQKAEELNAVAERVREAERERAPVIRSFIAESPHPLFVDD